MALGLVGKLTVMRLELILSGFDKAMLKMHTKNINIDLVRNCK